MSHPDKRGYFSVKLGFGQTKNIKKPVKGELEKAGIKTPLRFLREFRLEDYKDKVKLIEEGNKKGLQIGEVKIFSGDVINPTLLIKSGDLITVSGISKGKDSKEESNAMVLKEGHILMEPPEMKELLDQSE